MTSLNRIAFIGNSLPRRCGIATFTTDLQQAVAASRARTSRPCIVAMTDHGHVYDYPPSVGLQIDDAAIGGLRARGRVPERGRLRRRLAAA